MKHRIRNLYTGLAVILLNSMVAGFLVYLVVFFWIPDQEDLYIRTPNIVRRYGLDALQAAYPGYTDGDLNTLLQETWFRSFVYSPYLQYREHPFRVRYVYVDEHGLRHCAASLLWPAESDA